ncbi:polysaccharide deacetylase family protein [Halopelagius longus]|uniref:Polysaccharide deacetylase n=1 Tax=Halopelagius longus TaxID=1236180 RepID=A0A1H1GIV7_9EURY|nr:polysaccharide deacetylase family protein [Halopelagius longus]RDI69715.1 polysaccharide deacetylase [Halopelagius longus]SDR13111.1 Polysaccharide deacetylase [Halopelagius longus]
MGSVVISLDAELGWGYVDYDDPPARVRHARSGWRTLLSMFDEYDVPATWAVVGHLMLEDCDGEHADVPASEGWFSKERDSGRFGSDQRFGGGLVKAVADASADHELGSHSFSHPEFDRIDRAWADAEVARCVELADERGYDLDSFAFPRNSVGHRDVLAEHGFTCYRGVSPVVDADSPLKPLRTLTGGTPLDRRSLLVAPRTDDHGLVNVPASLYLFSFEGTAQRIADPILGDPIVRAARRGIDQAADGDGVFHVWLHPNNVWREYTRERVRAILEYLDERRRDSALTVETMNSVAEAVR